MLVLSQMLASKISIDNAKPEKLFYFVANAVVYRPSDGRCLLLKRSDQEKVFPGKWAVPGGKLEWADFDISKPDRTLHNEVVNFVNPIEKLLIREIKEEAGIDVEERLDYSGKSVLIVRPDEIPVVFVVFIATYKSGEVKLEEGAFTDSAWVNAEEVKGYDCIEGIDQEIAGAIDRLSK